MISAKYYDEWERKEMNKKILKKTLKEGHN
jgi:hypothetical protein